MNQRLLISLLLLLGLPVGVSAQTTLLSPTSVFAFAPSADHSATSPVTSTPVVASYELDFYQRPTSAACPATVTTAPTAILNIGKPALTNGEVRSGPIVQMNDVQENVLYCAYARAVGPGGSSARSAPVGPFGREVIQAPGAPGTPTIATP